MNQQPCPKLQIEVESWIESMPEVVWQLLIDVGNWGVWNTNVCVVKSNGLLDAGQNFIFRTRQTKIHATVFVANQNRTLSWRGEGRGLIIQQSWFLIPHNNGTLVVSEVRAEGSLIQIVSAEEAERLIRSGLNHWLECLRTKSEQQVLALA